MNDKRGLEEGKAAIRGIVCSIRAKESRGTLRGYGNDSGEEEASEGIEIFGADGTERRVDR